MKSELNNDKDELETSKVLKKNKIKLYIKPEKMEKLWNVAENHLLQLIFSVEQKKHPSA